MPRTLTLLLALALGAGAARAQAFEPPIAIAPWLYAPGRAIVEPQPTWSSWGAGASRGLDGAEPLALAAQATFGGAYHHLAVAVGVHDRDVTGASPALGVGALFHYNVWQDASGRVRLGHHLGASSTGRGSNGTSALRYRARGDVALHPRLALFASAGGETSWIPRAGPDRRTHWAAGGGVFLPLGARLGLALGIDAVFDDPVRRVVAASLHFAPRPPGRAAGPVDATPTGPDARR